MNTWLRAPQIVLPSPTEAEKVPRTGDWAHHIENPESGSMSEPRNLYWVPVKRKHDFAPVLETIQPNSFTKRQTIPALDEKSTAGVIAAIVLSVIVIIGVLVFLVWRDTRYQSKTKDLKLEAAEMTQSSDTHQKRRIHSSEARLGTGD